MIVYLNRATIIKSSKTFLNVLDELMEQFWSWWSGCFKVPCSWDRNFCSFL